LSQKKVGGQHFILHYQLNNTNKHGFITNYHESRICGFVSIRFLFVSIRFSYEKDTIH